MDKFQGVPYGLFLGPKVWFGLVWINSCFIPSSVRFDCADFKLKFSKILLSTYDLQELEEVGGTEELEEEINKRIKRKGTLDTVQ